MKTHILAGIVIAGALAASAAQASMSTAEEIYSGMSAAEIQQNQQANPAAEQYSADKETCAWHEAETEAVDQVFAPYPGNESNFGEKDYLAAENFNFVC